MQDQMAAAECPSKSARAGECFVLAPMLALLCLTYGCAGASIRGHMPSAGALPTADDEDRQFLKGKITMHDVCEMWVVFLPSSQEEYAASWNDISKGTISHLTREEQEEVLESLSGSQDSIQFGEEQISAIGAIIIRRAGGGYSYLHFDGKDTYMTLSCPPPIDTSRDSVGLWAYLKQRYPSHTNYVKRNEKTNDWWRTYYRKGNLHGEFPLKNGKLHGPGRILYSDGKVSELFEYRNGVEEGINWSFGPDGDLSLQRTYKNGQLNGAQRVYGKDGLIEHETWFLMGKEVSFDDFKKNAENAQYLDHKLSGEGVRH